MKVYVASSWRNQRLTDVIGALRGAGFDVYDFRNPDQNGGTGFHWSEVDPGYKTWTPGEFVAGLDHAVAQAGYTTDMRALAEAHIVVLVLPCGKSAHLELGFAAGAGKMTAILLDDMPDPELMYRMADRVVAGLPQLIETCKSFEDHILAQAASFRRVVEEAKP